MSVSTTSSKSQSPSTSTVAAPPPAAISALAAQAIAQLEAIEAMLSLDIVIPPNDKHQIGALNRVPDAAIGLAADIVSRAPDRFPDFTDLPAAASYVEVMGQVARRASELAAHVQKSVQNQRGPAAIKTLALYAVAKGLGRITDNETMREKVTALRAQVAPKRPNAKPRETNGQKAAKRVAKQLERRVEKAKSALAVAEASLPRSAPAVAPSPLPPTLLPK